MNENSIQADTRVDDREWLVISANSERLHLTDISEGNQKVVDLSRRRAGLVICLIIFLLFGLFCRPFSYIFSQEPYLTYHICNSSVGQNIPNLNTPGFDFTFGIIIILFFLRCVEAWVILVNIFKYFFKRLKKESCCLFEVNQDKIKQLTHNAWEKIVTKYKAMGLTIIVIIFMIISSVAVVYLEMDVRLKSIKESESCRKFMHWLNLPLELFRYGYDLGVRILMIVATLAVKNIWDLKDDKKKGDSRDNVTGCFSSIRRWSKLDQGMHPDNSFFVTEKESQYKEPTTRTEYDRDRRNVSGDFKIMKKDHYEHRGDRAREIVNIFSTWFIIPWVLYFIEISLDADDLLKVWTTSDNEYEIYNMPQVAFFVYNINQIIFLLVPYICSHIMNAAHKKYIVKLRSKQLEKYRTGSRKALAVLHKIEKNEDYDFTPRVLFSKIEVCIQQPFYAALLLLSLFFALSNSLIK